MASYQVIKASARPRSGKGAARQVRREGKVPGVIYGDKKDAQAITLDYHEVNNLLHKGRFLATVFELDVDGQKSRAVPRDIQLDPVKDLPLHVDFQRIGADNRVKLMVPVRFINEALSPGLKRGGVLNIVRREVEVWCPADRIPEQFEVNLEGLEIGRSVHISAVKMPDSVSPTITRDFTVATIAGKKAEEEEVKPTTEVAAEGAVPAEGAAPAPGAAPAAAAAGDAKAAAGKAAAPAAGGKAPAADKAKK